MPQLNNLKFKSNLVSMSLTKFGEIVNTLVTGISDKNKVLTCSLIFKSYNPYDGGILTMENIVQNRIAIMDYVLFNNLKDAGESVAFVIDKDLPERTEDDYAQALIFAYFMFVTRGKSTLQEGEKLPNFLSNMFGSRIDPGKLGHLLTLNPIEKINHEWVKEIKVDQLGESFRNRISSGISGCRLINVFKNYTFKNDLDAKILSIANEVRKIASSGPYWEIHPNFMPMRGKMLNISKSLSNLILEVFSEETIDAMVKAKAIFEKPKFNMKYNGYKQWDSTTFAFLSSKVFGE